MRALRSAAIAVMLATSAAAAEEPTAPVAKAYAIDGGAFDVTKGVMPWEGPSREALFSARLAALLVRDERYGREAHSVGLLEFDPFLNRQCCGVGDLKLKVVSQTGAKAVVEATFQSVGAQKVLFETIVERGAWLIDDIRDRDEKGGLVSIAQILQGQHACGLDAGKPCRWPPPSDAPTASAGGAPADLVKAIYRIAFSHVRDQSLAFEAYSDKTFRARFFTAAMRLATDGLDAMFLKYHDEILDFDPVLSANGFADPSNFVVRTASADARSALVVASFGKGKERASVAYKLDKTGDGWRVDDISSAPGATGNAVWSLRKIYDMALLSHSPATASAGQ